MQTKENIENSGLLYPILNRYIGGFHRRFYKRVVIIGKENIPRDHSYFITPNHQNALMDAMAILYTIGRPYPVFMARADMFKKKSIAKILYFLKILPVFRIRDGKDSLKNNSAVFGQTIGIVSKGVPLIIYPEGNHDGHHRFRGVKKGVIRTAFTALETFEEGKKLYIVPTGIQYNGSYEKPMQDLVVCYGKPLLVNDFYDLYKEDSARAERKLQLALYARISDQMIDIKTEDYYSLFDTVRETAYHEVLNQESKEDTLENKLYAQQKVVSAMTKALDEDETPFAILQEKATKYSQLTKKLQLKDWLFNIDKLDMAGLFLKSLLCLVTLPIALYGWVFNALPIVIANKQAMKMKDAQWRSSLRFVMSFTSFNILYLILALLSMLLFANNWWALVVLVTFKYSLRFAMMHRVWVKKIFGQLRYNSLRKRGDVSFVEATQLREELNSFVLRKM